MKTVVLISVGLAALAGCGGSDQPTQTSRSAAEVPQPSTVAPATAPRVTGDLPDPDRQAVTAVVADYVRSLDHYDAGGVCGLFAPGGLDLRELPRRRGGCEASVRASIGVPPAGGAPAWRKTELHSAKETSLQSDRARVTATVTHRFSDRKYVSVEDDVIYLEKIGERWLIAKPSATFYRAVGYPEPPLRALSPPPGW